MTADMGALRRTLTARLAVLDNQVALIEREQRAPLDDDFAEQAVAREDDETLDALEQAALQEIELTCQALERLDEGRYGICTNCGEAIAPARLAALPAAALCLNCAAEA